MIITDEKYKLSFIYLYRSTQRPKTKIKISKNQTSEQGTQHRENKYDHLI